MPTLTLKFQKFDKFKNAVFIATEDSLSESYERLKKYHTMLEQKGFNTFLPIYAHPTYRYSTIRFFKNNKFKNFRDDATYELDFMISTTEKEGRTFVNCYIQSMRFIAAAPKLDMGTELNLDEELQ